MEEVVEEGVSYICSPEREREGRAQRLGEGVAGVSDKWHTQGGCAGEVGWNKCYRGARDCVFPMVRYPLPLPTHRHPSLHGPPPKPTEPAPSLLLLLLLHPVVLALSQSLPCQERSGQAQFHSTGPVCFQ